MLTNHRLALILIAIMAIVSCKKTTIPEGVTLELAKERKANISEIVYSLQFTIPEIKSESITGRVDVEFTTSKKTDIILDFRGTPEMLNAVLQGDKPIDYRFENGHILIPKKNIVIGKNSFTLEFTSGDGTLNRSDEFLYTLLVPDRASTVFPCFDQPDLKASFNLSLNIPTKWTGLSNGKIDSITYLSNTEKRISFKPTKPISTYLFAFAVGNFQVETKTVRGRKFSLYHRETDKEKLERNLPIIFDLHEQSLTWLEEYTGIPYPFEKLDFILIPGFQYSGMEHPGAIFYRDTRLLLDKDPTVNQQLRKANLIAHEVAHQWFGNLVTMRWFNDVWLKEVFAGFMADLMVNPQYPEINHQLGFLLSHFPRAYSVDRTQGANPIVQPLDNMLFAGTLYGDIIYHKAPIMMQQLEMLMGAEAFKMGVQEYLNAFFMANADWDELVTILDSYTEINLKEWAAIWTLDTGRPVIGYSHNNQNDTLELNALDSSPLPPMWFDVKVNKTESPKRIWLDKLPKVVALDSIDLGDEKLIVNASGIAYGCFVPDYKCREWIIPNINSIENPVARASTHISLFEMFLEGLIELDTYTQLLINSIENEKESQLQSYILNSLLVVFWQFTPNSEREEISSRIENTLWRLAQSSLPLAQRRAIFSTLASIFITNESFSKLYNAWVDEKIFDIQLSEQERTNLAYELMIRKPELYHTIALAEVERISNPDRIAQFDFILGAISPNPSHRISFFESLKKPANRKPEPWVSSALYWLHHPLRSDFSLRFIEPSLDMLPEIQQTGDIFFPKAWLDATLWGHSSAEANVIVRNWMKANPKLSKNLKSKLLQSADMLFRVTE